MVRVKQTTKKSQHGGKSVPGKKIPDAAAKRPFRFKPNTIAKMKVRREQKHSTNFALPPSQIRRLIVAVLREEQFTDQPFRISANAVETIHTWLEDNTTDLLNRARMSMAMAKRKMMNPAIIEHSRILGGEIPEHLQGQTIKGLVPRKKRKQQEEEEEE